MLVLDQVELEIVQMKRVLDVFRLVNDRLVGLGQVHSAGPYQIFHLSLHLKVIQVLVIVLFKLVYQ